MKRDLGLPLIMDGRMQDIYTHIYTMLRMKLFALYEKNRGGGEGGSLFMYVCLSDSFTSAHEGAGHVASVENSC